ncbi:plastin-2 [Lingula anatina]|uniref:Plastin-2 n=1 Tax=Lingula anatina TaxID=7574 RepID=A0A1S3J9B2_LINAN|nr:plastin-2 [Lingula anatina]|eukprot:XP_013406990.1 plastin-2 [Lingula anatina]
MAGIRQSVALTVDQEDDLKSQFQSIDADGSGYISLDELQFALETVGFKLPGHEIRELRDKYDRENKDGKLDYNEFKKLCADLTEYRDLGRKFKKLVTKRSGLETHGGMTEASSEGTTHSVRIEEQIAFSNWINRGLTSDKECAKYLPLQEDGKDLYEKCKDGILLCKMINLSVPDTIDERAINKENLNVYKRHENLMLALNSASSIGCNIVNIGAEDIDKGKPHLLLGLLWQVIRIGLLSDINLQNFPGLVLLLEEDETIEDLMKLSPEAILIRWVNYHLRNANCGRQISNFTSDIKDSVAYIHLLGQIAPPEKGVHTNALQEPDDTQRAELMLDEADKINCKSFVSAKDVVSGNYKLNLAFVANLFNTYPALEPPTDKEFEVIEETREEKTYRNWMNSMGVNPFVNHLYSDLRDALVLFQLYDKIKPGIVDWNKVTKVFKKLRMNFQKIENCNYAVDLGKQMKFSLVGIGGTNIHEGNETLTLALVWQLMRAYTLSILAQLSEKSDGKEGKAVAETEIVQWANEKLSAAKKPTQIASFQDPTIADAKVVIDLVDAIKPGSIKYNLVKDGASDEEKLANAKYAVSMARKIGAKVYALPEDIMEVKPKMVMTVFACLMIRDMQSKQVSLED